MASLRPQSLAEWVSTFQGTDSPFAFSQGNTLPLTSRPHGTIGWTPQTAPGNWSFDFRSPTLQGFRGTHQPSPWTSDYGNFLVLVGSGPQPPLSGADGESFYRKSATAAHPHCFRTRLERHGIVAGIAPTQRGGSFRLTYERRENAWLTFLPAAGRVLSVGRDRRLIMGVSTAIAAGAALPGEFGCFFAAEIGSEIAEFGVYDARAAPPCPDASTPGVWLRLVRPQDGAIAVKIATSFISADQALLNLRRELGGASFDQTQAAAQAEWDRRLGAIAIAGATDDQRRTFYGCLYRSLLLPHLAHEIDASDRPVHRSFFNASIQPGPVYTDIGFWDAHRSLMPLLTLIAPEQHGEMIQGWVNAFKEGGWLPSWACPGYIPCMVGSHAGMVIADAYLKGIRNFDVATAYAAVRHDATQEPPSFACGRSGLARFNELGWGPYDEFDHSAEACYVSDVTLNGRPVQSLELAHAAIVGGGELVFTMSRDAERGRARGVLPRPFSLSTAAAPGSTG